MINTLGNLELNRSQVAAVKEIAARNDHFVPALSKFCHAALRRSTRVTSRVWRNSNMLVGTRP
jgi:hypothetical protein